MIKKKNLIKKICLLYNFFIKKKIKKIINNYFIIQSYIYILEKLYNKIKLNKLDNKIKWKKLYNKQKFNFFKWLEIKKKKKFKINIIKNEIYYYQNKRKYFYLLIRFVRKNLFLTLLNKEGNVLCKTNIGTCGFKKRIKFTGYAIKNSCRKFSEKILKFYIITMNKIKMEMKLNLYTKSEIEDNFILNNLNFVSEKFLLKKKKIKNYQNNLNINLKKKNIFNKIKNKIFKYRNYLNIKNQILDILNIKIRFKSSLKFWGINYVMYGLYKRFHWFEGIEIRVPIFHSKGLRLKKKRRV